MDAFFEQIGNQLKYFPTTNAGRNEFGVVLTDKQLTLDKFNTVSYIGNAMLEKNFKT